MIFSGEQFDDVCLILKQIENHPFETREEAAKAAFIVGFLWNSRHVIFPYRPGLYFVSRRA
jgi:hypothetical protein